MREFNRLTDEQKIKSVEMYVGGQSYSEVGRTFSVTSGAIAALLKRRGIKSRGCVRLRVDDRFFEVVDAPEKAYFLGFLYADGYIDEKRHHVELSLQSKDKYILEKLNRLVNHEKELTYRKAKKHWKTGNMESDGYRLYIKNKKIAGDLVNLGMRQRKSFTLAWPKFLTGDLAWHFVRGYFDGDGSICIKTNGQGTRYGCCSIISSVDFIKDLSVFLLDNGLPCGIDKHVGKYSKPMRSAYISKINDIHTFYRKIYNNCGEMHLTRKKEKFEELFKLKGYLLNEQFVKK